LAENDNEVATAWYTSLGTNVVYNNGETSDIKTYVGAGFKYQLVDQNDKGGNDLVISSLSEERRRKLQTCADSNTLTVNHHEVLDEMCVESRSMK
jgi:hypothetical protein